MAVNLPCPREREVIGWDVDVQFGAWPASGSTFGAQHVANLVGVAGIDRALLASTRGGLFDAEGGNDEAIDAARGEPVFAPVGTVNLRNALHAEQELDRLASAGVRMVRLHTKLQAIEPDFPGLLHVAELAASKKFVVLADGDVRSMWRPFAGRDASVVFLEVHAYHVADFVLLARREPGFIASTRLLNAPDSIERVAGEAGHGHVVFGSGAPLHDVSPAALRLRTARLDGQQWQAVAGGTIERLLGGESS